MWFRILRVSSSRILFLILSVSNGLPATFSISNFNASIRDYALQDSNDTSQVRTLQKEGPVAPFPYGGFVPVHNYAQYKEAPDNVISSSSHSRGLAAYEHGGYGPQDYEDGVRQFDHARYHHHDFGLYDHGYGHGHEHLGHHAGFGHGGHYHKHYDHALSAKFLLPVAGLALLGAAAALVSNPILLQLGVVSGRRRRDTSEATTGPGLDLDILRNWPSKPEIRENHIVQRLSKDKRIKDRIQQSKLKNYDKGGSDRAMVRIENRILHGIKNDDYFKKNLKTRNKDSHNKKRLLKKLPMQESSIEAVTLSAQTQDHIIDDGFIPVSLKWNEVV